MVNYMLSVNEAVNQLKEAGIISNPEILRRRLRAGKVKRAFIESNRHGWKIPEETISNIVTANEDKSSNKEYDKGYQDGYDAALMNVRQKYVNWLPKVAMMNNSQSIVKISVS